MNDYSFVSPEAVGKLLSDLGEKGIKAYPVGGCVRDRILGKTPKDYDFTAETVPEKLEAALNSLGYRFVETGIKYGTLTVIAGEYPVEVTCCRSDGEYSDNRRPDSVCFTCDLRDDLSRRDFTVNAIAYSEKDGFIDPFGGIPDAEKGIIRAVGDPRRRFGEDALRILRGLRFSSVLGFEIEKETSDAIHEMYHLLSDIAVERIYIELKKLLTGKDVYRILMDYSDVITCIVPELAPAIGFEQHNYHHDFTVYEHIARSVSAAPEDTVIRLTMFLHDVGKPSCFKIDGEGVGHFKGHDAVSAEIAKTVLERLSADRETADNVIKLVKYHDLRPEPTRKSVRRYLNKLGYTAAIKLLSVRRADVTAQKTVPNEESLDLIRETEEIIDLLDKEGACVSLKTLAVGGDDLIALGMRPGKEIGEELHRLLALVVDEVLPNEKEALLKEVSRRL